MTKSDVPARAGMWRHSESSPSLSFRSMAPEPPQAANRVSYVRRCASLLLNPDLSGFKKVPREPAGKEAIEHALRNAAHSQAVPDRRAQNTLELNRVGLLTSRSRKCGQKTYFC